MKEASKPEPRKQAEASQQRVPESKHLSGDGLRLKMHVNRDSLWIDGDGCHVKLGTNYGLLRVTGDGCQICIGNNLGSLEYLGDGGRVLLGPESRLDGVVYKGDGGVVEVGEIGKHKDMPATRTTRKSTQMRNGRIVVTYVTAEERDAEKSSVFGTKVAAGRPVRVDVNVNGVNGKCSCARDPR